MNTILIARLTGALGYFGDFFMVMAGVCLLWMVISSLDVPLLRKVCLSGRFSLRTMFTFNAVIAVDIAFLRSLNIHFHSFFDIVFLIVLVTPGSYVLVTGVTIWLQDLFGTKSNLKTLNPPLPETVAIATPIEDRLPASTEVNFDFLGNCASSEKRDHSKPVAKDAGYSTQNIHPT